jgi:redox-sensing transcriptional repressor
MTASRIGVSTSLASSTAVLIRSAPTVGSLTVEPIEKVQDYVQRHQCQIAIMAVPAEAAQEVADMLIEVGIKSILCYAPITLNIPKHIRVEYIDPVIHFQHMTFYLEQRCLED